MGNILNKPTFDVTEADLKELELDYGHYSQFDEEELRQLLACLNKKIDLFKPVNQRPETEIREWHSKFSRMFLTAMNGFKESNRGRMDSSDLREFFIEIRHDNEISQRFLSFIFSLDKWDKIE